MKNKFVIISTVLFILSFFSPISFAEESSQPTSKESSQAIEEQSASSEVKSSPDIENSSKDSSQPPAVQEGQESEGPGITGGGGESSNGILPYTSNTKINVDPSSGSASTSFPISVPPGRAGIQPNLALSYNSSLKNSPLGMGWDLNLGTIEISTKKGFPKYDGSEQFVLNQGSNQELVWDSVSGFYRARIEGAFMKTERVSDYWVVTDKKGIKYYFGQTNASRQYDPDPNNSTHIFKWYLDKVEDLFGNYMTIEYTKDQNQVYPSKVLYTGNSKQGLSPYAEVDFEYDLHYSGANGSFLSGFEVKTDWRLKEIDCLAARQLQQSYQLSYEISQVTERSLLKEITVHSRYAMLPSTTFAYQNEDNSSPVTYNFTSTNNPVKRGDNLWNYQYGGGYDHGHDNYGPVPGFDVPLSPTYTQSSGSWSGGWWNIDGNGLLTGGFNQDTANLFWTYLYVDQDTNLFVPYSTQGVDGFWLNGDYSHSVGPNWNLKSGYNLVEFTIYHQHSSFGFDLNYDLANHVAAMDSAASQWMVPQLGGDFNGDGLSDTATFSAKDGTVKVKLSSLNGFQGEQTWISGFGTKFEVVPGDFNGDGKTDIASFNRDTGEWKVALSDGGRFNDAGTWLSDGSHTGSSVYGPNAADFNSDGLTDVMIFYKESGVMRAEIIFSKGNSFALSSPRWQPSIGSDTRTPFAADFNGDGLPDFGSFYKDAGAWDFYLNPGRIGASFPRTAGLGNFGTNEEIAIADFNGDGLTDIGYYEKSSGRIFYKTSQDGYNFGQTQQLPINFSPNQTTMQIQSGDYNGDGLTDFATSNGLGLFETSFSTSGQVSDLLFETKNGIGGTTDLTYTSSCFTKDSLLPFCIPLVKSVVVENDLNTNDRYETRYEYTQGLWDWQDREFRGFGTVKTIDPDGNYSLVQFLQDDIYKGRPSKQTSFDASGREYTETNNTWDYSLVRDQAEKIYFPFLKRADQYIYEGNAAAKRTAVEYGVPDSYGNLTDTYELGEVDFNTGSDLITQDNRHSQTVYVLNEGMWLLGLPKQTLIKDYQDQILRESRFTYDRLNWGDAPTLGLLTQKEDISGEAGNPITQYDYDDYGNLKKTIDPLGHETTITYDSTYHLFPVTTVNALGQTVNNRYYEINNRGFQGRGLWGQVESTTDPNQQVVKKSYDEFGRVKKMISPLDSISLPTSEVEYDLENIPIRVKTKARVESGKDQMMESVQFYDGLGRLIQTKSLAETQGQYVVSGQAVYNRRGLVERQYLPFFTNDPLDVVTTIDPAKPSSRLEYDAMGRVVKTTNPDGTYSQVKYEQWAVETIDENRHMQKSLFDAFGRLVSRQEYSGNAEPYQFYAETKYEYDITGNLTKVIDAHQNETKIEYDKLGRKTDMYDLDMGHWHYDYDLNGNLQYQTDAKGQVLEFKYDVLNRLENKKDAAAIMNVDYLYDEEAIPFGRGRLRKAQYGSPDSELNNTEFTYDALGREIESIKTIDAVNYKVGRSYDALNRLKKIVYPQGEELFYSYNAAGQIETVSNIPNEEPPQKEGTVLLIHADGEDGSQDFVDTTGQHLITPVGDVHIDTQEKAVGTGSARFDGDGDYLRIPDSDDWYLGTRNFKIDFWFYPELSPYEAWTSTILDQKDKSGDGLTIYIENDLTLTFSVTLDGNPWTPWVEYRTEPLSFSLGSWNHAEIVRDGTAFYIFINGIQQEFFWANAIGDQSIPNFSGDLIIGNGSNFDSVPFDGWIDEVEISFPPDQAPEENPPEQRLYIPADGQDGSRDFVDATGRHLINSFGDVHIDTQEKAVGTGSARFDGDGDYLRIPDSDDWNFGTNDFSIDFSMKSTNSGADQWLIDQSNVVVGSFEIYIINNKLNFYAISSYAQEIAKYTTKNPQAIFDGLWHHIEVIRNGTNFYIKVDGESQDLIEYTAIDTKPMPDVTGNIFIGSRGLPLYSSYGCFIGWIDEFKIIRPPKQQGVGSGGAQSQEPVTYIKNVDYNAQGQTTKIEYGNGVTTTYEYDPKMLRLTRLLTVNSSLLTVQDLNYTYDNVGNILTITDGSGRGMNQIFSYDELNRLKTAAGKYFNDGNSSGTKTYVYDEVGNIDQIIETIDNDETIKDYTYGENSAGPHAVTSITKGGASWLSFKYDLNGNMVEQDENSVVTAYEYDAENRLTKVTQDAVPISQYEYDGDGGRVKKIVYTEKAPRLGSGRNSSNSALQSQGRGVKFSFDRWAMARDGSLIPRSQSEREGNSGLGSFAKEPRSSFSKSAGTDGIGNTEILPPDSSEGWKPGSPSRGSQEHFNGDIETTKYVGSLYEVAGTKQTRFIFLGSQRIAAVDSTGKTTYYHGNHLGSTNVTTDADGSLDELFENEPFGQITTHEKYGSDEETAKWYFTGKELDTESGLIFFGARYYNPAIGRFITPDTLVQDPYNPQTLNRYSYTSNNPINYIDPDGHKWSWTKFWHAAVGIFVGVIATLVLGPGGALAWYGWTMAGIIGGALGGAITGGLDGGWKGALIGGLMGGALGGLGGWAIGGGHTFLLGAMFAAGVGNAAATNSWDSFAGGIAGGILGSMAGNAINGIGQTSSTGNGDSSNATEAIQETVENNSQDLQGAIDAGRGAGGESGAMAAAGAVTKVNAEVDVAGSLGKMGRSFILDKAGEVNVKVPYAGKGAVFGGKVFLGGAKGIVARAANALGVAAKVTGKALGAFDTIKYFSSGISALRSGNGWTALHDFGRAGLEGMGVFGVKVAPYLGEAMDAGTKVYGNAYIH